MHLEVPHRHNEDPYESPARRLVSHAASSSGDAHQRVGRVRNMFDAALNWLVTQFNADPPSEPTHEIQPGRLWVDSGLELVWLKPNGQEEALALDRAVMLLGRQTANSTDDDPLSGSLQRIPCQDETVSRRQAALVWSNGGYVLHHLPSAKNPTLVDDREDTRFELCDGQTIRFGNARMYVRAAYRPALRSTFVLNVCARLSRTVHDEDVPSDYALTVLNGPGRGETFLLTRCIHALHTTSGPRLVPPSPGHVAVHMRGQDRTDHVLLWDDRSQSYMFVHNVNAGRAYIHTGDGEDDLDVLSVPSSPRQEVQPFTPTVLMAGDTICVGKVKLRFHRCADTTLQSALAALIGSSAPRRRRRRCGQDDTVDAASKPGPEASTRVRRVTPRAPIEAAEPVCPSTAVATGTRAPRAKTERRPRYTVVDPEASIRETAVIVASLPKSQRAAYPDRAARIFESDAIRRSR